MPIFTSGCNSISTSVKTIKIEGNNLQILSNGNVVYNSTNLRFWYNNVSDWSTTKFEIAPSETKTLTFDFNFIYINITQPNTTVTTLGSTIKLFDGVTEKLFIPIQDFFVLNSRDNYTSIEISNTSTGLTNPMQVDVLLTNTLL